MREQCYVNMIDTCSKNGEFLLIPCIISDIIFYATRDPCFISVICNGMYTVVVRLVYMYYVFYLSVVLEMYYVGSYCCQGCVRISLELIVSKTVHIWDKLYFV